MAEDKNKKMQSDTDALLKSLLEETKLDAEEEMRRLQEERRRKEEEERRKREEEERRRREEYLKRLEEEKRKRLQAHQRLQERQKMEEEAAKKQQEEIREQKRLSVAAILGIVGGIVIVVGAIVGALILSRPSAPLIMFTAMKPSDAGSALNYTSKPLVFGPQELQHIAYKTPQQVIMSLPPQRYAVAPPKPKVKHVKRRRHRRRRKIRIKVLEPNGIF